MSIFYRNTIVAVFWGLITFLVIQSHTSQMFLAMLFTVAVLHLSEFIAEKYLTKDKSKKIISLILSASILSSVGYSLYLAFVFMGQDIGHLIEASQPAIKEALGEFGLEKNFQTISDLYTILIVFLKANIGFITFSAGLLLKVIIGIILGVVVHMSHIDQQNTSNAWGSIVHTINSQCKVIYTSFRDIMSIQILISLMNTTIIAAMALGLTYVIYGQVLPYWYVIIPLTAILSLIPVVGNIMINIILILATVQVSPTYVLVGLGLFLAIHKLELIVVGNKMNEKVNVPFIIVLFSMILGELLFHSMSGMMLGLIIMISLSKLLREINVVGESKVQTISKKAHLENSLFKIAPFKR